MGGEGEEQEWGGLSPKKIEILTTPHPNISFTNLVAFVKGWRREEGLGEMYEIKLGGGKGRSGKKRWKKWIKWGQGKEGKRQAKNGKTWIKWGGEKGGGKRDNIKQRGNEIVTWEEVEILISYLLPTFPNFLFYVTKWKERLEDPSMT